MEKELLESLRAKSREERMAYFAEHKSELMEDALSNVNGGEKRTYPEEYANPNSDVPDPFGTYYSSWYFVCRGTNICD